MEFIGKFELGERVDITDPCYDFGTFGTLRVNCQPGTYYGYAEVKDFGEDGKRTTFICITKDDSDIDFFNMESIGVIGVDAGLAGFFNNKPDYDDDAWMKFLKRTGVFKEDGEYDYDRTYYKAKYGVFSESGFGDGCYEVYANKERNAFEIAFIEEE